MRSFPWQATIVVAIVLLAAGGDARAKRGTPRKPVAVVPADADEDADSEGTEAEGPERIIERLRWFREGRLGRDGEISPDARNRALRQLDENIQNGILRAQPLGIIPGDGWVSVGPTPIFDGNNNTYSGRVTALAVHPSDGNIAYLGSAQGGVWKTTDHGATWTPLTDTQRSLSVGSIAIAPSNPNVIYVGTGEANSSCDSYFGVGILKSIDGGATWSLIGASSFAGSSISKIVVDPASPNLLWAANTTGNGGFVCSGSNIAVSVGVWKSTDGGASWTRTLSAAQTTVVAHTHDLVLHPIASPRVLYAGVDHSGIWRSTDGGSTWTRLSTGLPASSAIGRVAIAIDPVTPTTLYALFADFINGRQYMGTYKTVTSGTSWSLLLNSKQSGTCQFWSFQDVCTYSGGTSGQCWYDLTIGVAGDHSVWAGGAGLWRSTNGGGAWTGVCPVSLHPDQHALAFSGSDTWVGNDGGVFTTASGGIAWTSRNPGLALTQFYPGGALHPTNASIALGGAQDNGMLYYGGGPSWNQLGTGDGAFNAIDFTNPAVLYLSTQYLNIWKYDGASWSNATNGLLDSNTTNTGFISPFAMCPNDPQTLIAGSNNMWRTTNGAASWSFNSPDPLDTGLITAVAFAPSTGDCGTYFAASRSGHVFRTTNAGASWTDISSNLPGRGINDIAVDPTSPATVIVALSAFGTSHAWRTTNALDPVPNWFFIDSGIPDVPVNAVLIDPTAVNVLYLGTDIGIFRSTDNGTSWGVFMGGHPNAAVYDLVANAATGTIFSFTHGRGVFKLGTFCSDGNACTTDTYDQLLGCQHSAIACVASDACHVVGTCDSGTGLCSHPSAPDGTTCTDGDACTQSDSCQSGACTGGSPLICAALDQCHVAGTCDSGTGLCSDPNAPDGSGCDDASLCTLADSCQSGACTSGSPVICPAPQPCHLVGTCDAGTGLCSDPTIASDGSACSDGDLCTLGDSCQGAACVGGSPVTCAPSDQCHLAGTCDPPTGCSNPTAPDGTGCDDGSACTTADACTSGACAGTPGTPPGPVTSVLVAKTGVSADLGWDAIAGATAYDILRGRVHDWPVGSHPGTETCFDDLVATTGSDGAVPIAGDGYWYLIRAENACGNGGYGFEGLHGAPTTPRLSGTCP